MASLFSLVVVSTTPVKVSAANVVGCEFDNATLGVWSLVSDCTTSGPINVPTGTIVEGNGYTISAGYSFGSDGDGTNTVIGIVGSDNVVINNLKVDGIDGTSLNGVNIYVSENVQLNNVIIKNNDKYGLVVNGSNVTVNNLTTSGNGWGGVNVDLGSGVTSPAVLTINGVSSHKELVHVYLNNTLKPVSVIDTSSQYLASYPVTTPDSPVDMLYTLKSQPTSKDQCKNNGWKMLYTTDNKVFKNQGACVAYVAASDNAHFKRS